MAANTPRMRGKEAQLQIIFGTTRLAGSMRKITDWELTPRSDIVQTQFTGETRENNDLIVKGYDLTFNTHVNDFKWWTEVWDVIQTAERKGEPLPQITIVLTLSQRDGSINQIVCSDDLVMKLDSLGASGEDYVPLAWSVACQQAHGS